MVLEIVNVVFSRLQLVPDFSRQIPMQVQAVKASQIRENVT